MARRLKSAGESRDVLERTLDWLADGVALLRADGTIVYANDSFQAIARHNDGIRIRKNTIEFADSEARTRFNAAIASALKLRTGEQNGAAITDFRAARSAGVQSYFVSVRPVFGRAGPRQPSQAVAIAFVHDPLVRGVAPVGALREVFGLTEAEASLAQALQSGTTLADYARQRALSLNTVYTHLRRLREKTGCNRMTELIHRFNELRLPLRGD